ncbi:hypothetical protein M422DRAFT_76371 [Sphaerobolus stellatus SS14]|uniref:Pseudouridine synthase I TruA alpha/beta domain-containing protein n=1 Tax=Sphaerobolus stellatus (strain SS14) TaxID=990650 RepID=A0A0C9UJF6_SPHS4|nr:hypothetical protein M422DRAFT_76371 [Sphaerobolus stellatus SS14]
MRIPRRMPIIMSSSSTISPYHNWTREELIARLQQIDKDYSPQGKQDSQSAAFNFAAHPRRKIALKFCYAGLDYNGLAFQKDLTPLPTVEGVLFDALAKARLIDPASGFEGCGWERCGRTDKGVSAAGQVISLWVRSNIRTQEHIEEANTPSGPTPADTTEPEDAEGSDDFPLMTDLEPSFSSSCVEDRTSSTKEIPYIQVLNRVLPPTIRVLCWSPVSASFSARFNCKYRHYKYFFPATADLDIERMQDAAFRIVGSHDFRNLCTMDGSKQIENFTRHVMRAEISQVAPDESPTGVGAMYVFDLIGNAFLYNQVRSIMAILFLVGTGLEEPHVMSSLMNVDPTNPLPPLKPGEPTEIVQCRPSYQMADGLPLALWDCGYADGDVQWQADDGNASSDKDSPMTTNVRLQLASIYTRSRIRTTLDGHFLRAAAQFHELPYSPLPITSEADKDAVLKFQKNVMGIPIGGGLHIRTSKYRPLLGRERMEPASVVNERWRRGRGKKRWDERVARQARGDQIDDGDE